MVEDCITTGAGDDEQKTNFHVSGRTDYFNKKLGTVRRQKNCMTGHLLSILS